MPQFTYVVSCDLWLTKLWTHISHMNLQIFFFYHSQLIMWASSGKRCLIFWDLNIFFSIYRYKNMEVPFEFHRAKATWVAISKYFEIQFWLCDSKGTLKLLSLLGSKILGTKCIRTSMCNVLVNHDQNLESRFRLLKVYLFVKLELSNCRIYLSKSARLNRSKIRLDRLNLMHINFLQIFQLSLSPV